MGISRNWATPLVIGAFGIMAITGILMFFHLDTGLNKVAHEWLGWVLVVGAAAHVIVNWKAFARYFSSSNLARAIVGVCALVLAGSFVSPPGGGGDASPPALAIGAIVNAPIAQVAPLTGKPVEAVMDDLAKAGLALPNADATLASIAKGEREKIGRAMMVLFKK